MSKQQGRFEVLYRYGLIKQLHVPYFGCDEIAK
jgi:hypothetical protein